jgi:GH18 family chitinase
MKRRVVIQLWAVVLAGGVTDACRGAEPAAPPLVVVGYLPYYRMEGVTAERIGPVTDLIYFGIEPTAAGGFPDSPIPEEHLAQLQAFTENTERRLLLCVGGGGRSDGLPALADARRRAAFVEQLCRYCEDQRFDGVDFDWEFPDGDAQLAAYVSLVNETRAGLPEGALITVAQSPYRDLGQPMYDAVDRIHVMSYNHQFPQARIQDTRADVARMLRFGCPREKLVLGVPFYGRNQGGATRTYADLVRLSGQTPESDLVHGYSFNCQSTIREKADYVRDERLGGIMVWELGQDATDPAASLLRVIERRLNR